jgi:enoyl-CoA hydratase/carnithine racemase
MSDVFADIAGDREIKFLIHTVTGENYNANWGAAPGGSTVKPMYLAMEGQEGLMQLDEKARYGRMLVENVLAVEVPIIRAVNGPCSIHAEVPLLSGIVLASHTAYFQDLAHFPRGLVPGDGSHVLWQEPWSD